MIHTQDQQNSEVGLMSEVYKLSDAGASVIQVRTREPIRTALVLRKSIIDGGQEMEYKEWDVVNGFRVFTDENFTDNLVKSNGEAQDFITALETPLKELRKTGSSIQSNPNKIHYFVYVDAHPFLKGNPLVIELVQQYAAILPSTNVCLIFITPDVTLDDIPAGTLLVADMKTPSAEELYDVLAAIIENSKDDFQDGTDIEEEDLRQISLLGLGLTLYEFETYAALAIVDASAKKKKQITAEDMRAGIALGKTAVVKQSEILELYQTVDMSEVGGMQRLKDWVEERKLCYSEEAQDYGIEPPKGCAVVGVPGTGKSLIAKAIASTLGIPLVRFDFGRVFSKYVGDSEQRVRAALQMVEDMAPCVLFIDEIDKGLGGAGGGGDSGTSSRVLGTFLTWLNDCKAPVFSMVTANNIQGLPPELLRKGRLDQIFSVGMPNAAERREVLMIHLKKRGHELEFDTKAWVSFNENSNGYVPAEIEAAVKDALIASFNNNEELSMLHITAALKNMVPMSRAYAARIQAIVEWAADNATPVNYPEERDAATPPSLSAVPSAGSTVGTRRRVTRK